jgi:predicted acylesterase/phospholipase RssA
LTSRVELPTNAPGSTLLLEQIDRLYDSLPAGMFTLDRFERFLAGFFLRRGIPNTFRAMPRSLRVATYDLDSGERVMFGGPGHEDAPVSLACAASLALPVFFSPVRISGRHYLSGDVGRDVHLDVPEAAGATLCVVVSPLVPFQTKSRAVPTGHGAGESVRDKGLFGVFNQAMRIGAPRIESGSRPSGMHVLVVEPEPTDTLIFLHNPANLSARRAILEYAYRTTRERISRWIDRYGAVVERLGWRAA